MNCPKCGYELSVSKLTTQTKPDGDIYWLRCLRSPASAVECGWMRYEFVKSISELRRRVDDEWKKIRLREL